MAEETYTPHAEGDQTVTTTTKTTDVLTAALAATDDHELTAADGQVNEIRGQLDAVEREIHRVGTLPPAVSDLHARAEAMLAGHNQVDPAILRAEALGQYGLLCDRRKVLTEALKIAEARREVIHRRRSARVCQQILPAYKRLIERLHAALMPAAEANDELMLFTETLARHDIAFAGHLRPMLATFIGRASDPDSPANRWHREAIEYGLLEDPR
jgi:hypothetical protein